MYLVFFWSACYFFDVLVNGTNLIHILMTQKKCVPFGPNCGRGVMLSLHWDGISPQPFLTVPFSIVANLLFSLCALANDTGWPTGGKPNTGLKPPERRDSGTDTQGKSPPSGSPVTPSSEKVSLIALVLGVFIFLNVFLFFNWWLFSILHRC